MSIPPLRLGVVCTPEEWELSQDENNHDIHCLTRGQSIGLTLATIAALASLLAVLLIFLIILVKLFKRWRGTLQSRRRLLHGPADIYMLSLLIADMVQAVGTIMDIKWIHTGIVRTGGFCTAQGVVQQMGEVPVAATTLVIAFHTFITIWWRKGKRSRLVAFLVVSAIWIYPAVFVGIGLSLDDHYMTPTPYWCWIGPEWLGMRIAGEYAFLWGALIVSLLLYPLLALWRAGYVDNSSRSWWRISIHRKRVSKDIVDQYHANTPNLAKKMLAYPITYALMVLPLTIVRWYTFTGPSAPSAWTFLIITLYGFSGAANVLLLWLTKPQLLLLHAAPAPTDIGPLPSDHSGKLAPPTPSDAHPLRGVVPPLPADDSSDDEISTVNRAPDGAAQHQQHYQRASGGGRSGVYLEVTTDGYGMERGSHEGRPSTASSNPPQPGGFAPPGGSYV